jgi:hypothetical protein
MWAVFGLASCCGTGYWLCFTSAARRPTLAACLKFCAGIATFMEIVSLDNFVPYLIPIPKKVKKLWAVHVACFVKILC